MPELSDDQYEDLNYAVSSIRIGDDITVKYFRDYHTKTVFGVVTKLEPQKKEIWIDRKRIMFEEKWFLSQIKRNKTTGAYDKYQSSATITIVHIDNKLYIVECL